MNNFPYTIRKKCPSNQGPKKILMGIRTELYKQQVTNVQRRGNTITFEGRFWNLGWPLLNWGEMAQIQLIRRGKAREIICKVKPSVLLVLWTIIFLFVITVSIFGERTTFVCVAPLLIMAMWCYSYCRFRFWIGSVVKRLC